MARLGLFPISTAILAIVPGSRVRVIITFTEALSCTRVPHHPHFQNLALEFVRVCPPGLAHKHS